MSETEFTRVDTISYRGHHIDIYVNSDKVYCSYYGYCTPPGIRLDLSSENYDKEVRQIVDFLEDTTMLFSDFPTARLSWIDNGGYRDLALYCDGRMLKVFIVADSTALNIKSIREDCMHYLTVYSMWANKQDKKRNEI